jgi:transposase
MEDLLRANPHMYQDEIQEWLAEEWDIDVSQPTISRCIKELNLTRKRIERVNPDQVPELRALWLAKLTMHYTARQLVVVDESAVNERCRDRRWGWSPRGVVCRMKQDSPRSSRWSILPAIGINGYLEYEIYHGSFTSERFENFIMKLLRKMNPYPLPRSVLVMDNVASHHSPLVKQLCDAAGVKLEYLPPYSPDMSPIEESFSVLKAWMRRNREFSLPLLPFYDLFLHIAIDQCNFRETAKGFFKACKIEVTVDDVDVDYDTLK